MGGGNQRRPTARQLQIGELIACGYQNKEIARLLGVGPQTVKRHVRALYLRLGVCSRAELVGLLLIRDLVDRDRVEAVLEDKAATRIAIDLCC
jgi:LuxR family maltose regulon positive regulatory protein